MGVIIRKNKGLVEDRSDAVDKDTKRIDNSKQKIPVSTR